MDAQPLPAGLTISSLSELAAWVGTSDKVRSLKVEGRSSGCENPDTPGFSLQFSLQIILFDRNKEV